MQNLVTKPTHMRTFCDLSPLAGESDQHRAVRQRKSAVETLILGRFDPKVLIKLGVAVRKRERKVGRNKKKVWPRPNFRLGELRRPRLSVRAGRGPAPPAGEFFIGDAVVASGSLRRAALRRAPALRSPHARFLRRLPAHTRPLYPSAPAGCTSAQHTLRRSPTACALVSQWIARAGPTL